MNNTTETCKPDTYVGCPAPATIPPDCADGWEIGNGTITCATAVPGDLAATGLAYDPAAGTALSLTFIVLGAIGLATSRAMIRRGREKMEEEER